MGFPLIAFQNLRENLVQSIIFNVKRALPFGSPPLPCWGSRLLEAGTTEVTASTH